MDKLQVPLRRGNIFQSYKMCDIIMHLLQALYLQSMQLGQGFY